MVDCGITFADDTLPGVDVIMPDPAFIAERAGELDGLIVTHAHEDHIGAIQYLWPKLKCPVYATPFTAAVLRLKLIEAGLEHDVPITEVPLSGKFSVGPFEIELITLTHSIPEPNAVVLRTPLGTILHTGDWKFDPDPLVGEVSDMAALQRLGRGGRAGHDLRFHQRAPARRRRLRSRCAQVADRAGRALPATRGGGVLRLQRGAA